MLVQAVQNCQSVRRKNKIKLPIMPRSVAAASRVFVKETKKWQSCNTQLMFDLHLHSQPAIQTQAALRTLHFLRSSIPCPLSKNSSWEGSKQSLSLFRYKACPLYASFGRSWIRVGYGPLHDLCSTSERNFHIEQKVYLTP